MKNKLYIFFFLLLQANLFSQTACVQYDSNFTGFFSEYYPNGKTQWIKEFKDGQAVRIWMNFDEKGNLVKQLNTSLKRDSLRKDFIFQNKINSNNKIIEEKNQNTRAIDEDFWFEPGASFPGGNDSLNNFCLKNLVYPPDAVELNIQGKCFLKFVVEIDGTLTNISIVKGVPDCPQCDKEAIRVVKLMPPWLPETIQGQKVRSWGQLPINFILHD